MPIVCMLAEKQKKNQYNSFRQNTVNKTGYQISHTSSNNLINQMYKTNKKIHQQYEVQDDAGSQTKDIQLTLDEVDFKVLSENNSNTYENSNQQTRMQHLSGINFEYTESESFEAPKKLVKKSVKRDKVQMGQFKNKNALTQYTKQKNNQRNKQYIDQDEQQDKEAQITKADRPNSKKNQANDQIDTSQMVRVKPDIQIYQDKILKQSLTKSKVNEDKNIQLNEVKFLIEISLIPDDRPENNARNNVAAQCRIVPNRNFNTISNVGNLSSYSQNKSESNEVIRGPIKQVEKVTQKQQPKSASNTNNKIIRIENVQEEIQPVQMKESKIKNNFNRQTILKASMISEPSLKNSKTQQDLFYRNNWQIVNLAEVSLEDLVRQLYLKKIINQGLYKQFIQNHSIHDLKDYIIKFQLGKLHRFDYQKIKFTLLDHRKIAELLVNLYEDRYLIGKCHNSDPQVQNFLIKLYELGAQQYYYLYKKIDNISGLKWWSKILITQDERLMQVNKERRLTRRKAEQASLAVQELIQNARKKSTVSDPKLSQSQANCDKSATSIYKDHTAFFGQSEKQKELYKKRRQQIRELSQIRQMVNNNFSTKVRQNQQSENNKPSMRKKIRFY